WRKTGWYGRWYAVVDGEKVRVTRALGTTNKAAARRKLERLIAEGAEPSEATMKAPETVAQYAEAWLKSREGRGLRSVDYERRHFDRLWKPEIGSMPLPDVQSEHIRDLLERVADGRIVGPKSGKRYSRATLVH